MNRQIALAYAIAGLSAALSTVVVIGTTIGFDAPSPVAAASEDLLAQAPQDDARPRAVAAASSSAAAPPLAPAVRPVVEEVVYVDETGAPLPGPQATPHEDEDEDDEHVTAHEDHERVTAHEDDDDDDGRRDHRRAHRRDHDDD